MSLQPKEVSGGLYYFACSDGIGGTTVRLVAWLGTPLRWSISGEIGPVERRDLLAQGYDPFALLIDALLA